MKSNGESVQNRIILAKELGYLFLGYFDHYNTLYRRKANELENDVMYFAMELLTPEKSFINIVNQLTDSKNNVDIKNIANYFQITEDFVIARGCNLHLFEITS